ncbi:hypothetical protein ANN_22873 [Periplaneta americana]|uniref:Reverse transcriptase n=1 Tax=Periplaneta americana TaxID=6978 RepID=A0ABQ8SKY2_PERAM|nr:hypothetical protein ANN_22873 [Periplaneta americana]
MGRACSTYGESRNAFRVLLERAERKRPLERQRRRWENNIKMDLREVGYDVPSSKQLDKKSQKSDPDALKMVGYVAPVRAVPGRSRDGTRCRRCLSEIETLPHILGFCPYSEALRNIRHHAVRSMLAEALKEIGFTVHQKVQGLATQESVRRIDIIAIKNNSAYILDLRHMQINRMRWTVKRNGSMNQQSQAWHRKINILMGKPQPSFFHVLQQGQNEIEVIDGDIERLQSGISPTKKKIKYLNTDARISRIAERYENNYKNSDDVLGFLLAIGHNIAGNF